MIINRIQMLIAGASALSVAGVGAYVGFSSPHTEVATPDILVAQDQNIEICLKRDVTLFHETVAGCYSRAELAALRDVTVVDARSQLVLVMMTSPDATKVEREGCTTCRQFEAARARGWFASSSHDMRQEAYYIRACGIISLLLSARPATQSHFEDGSPTVDEVEAISSQILRFGNDRGFDPGPRVSELISQGVWRVSTASDNTLVEEIANADFDGDGIEEILATMVAGPTAGTASVAVTVLIEKDGPDAGLVLTPYDFDGPAPSARGSR